MKILIALLLTSSSLTALADTYVKGHIKSDGTYVQPHYRSDSNSSRYDNYSTQGNSNPYTGQQGTVDPYKSYEPIKVQPVKPYSIYGN